MNFQRWMKSSGKLGPGRKDHTHQLSSSSKWLITHWNKGGHPIEVHFKRRTLKCSTMELNFHAKLPWHRISVTLESVGFVAFQALASTLGTSVGTVSNGLAQDSTWPYILQNPMTTVKATMALKPYYCVMYFQAGNTSSKLTDSICRVPLLDTIVCMEMLERISTIQN